MKMAHRDAGFNQSLLFSNLSVRPEPKEMLGLKDSDIVKAAYSQCLKVNNEFFGSYLHNLVGLLPYYKQFVEQLVNLARQGHSIVCLGRDFDLIYDALKITLKNTKCENQIIHLPISGEIRDKLDCKSQRTHKFIGQYINFDKLFCGTNYVVADTGFMGTTIDWINMVALSATGKDCERLTERPVEGILIRTQGRPFLFEHLKPVYPQFILEERRFGKYDFILPAEMQKKRADLSYIVAAATQLMPKFYGHIDSIIEEEGSLLPRSSSQSGYSLPPIENIELKSESDKMESRLDWMSPIDPVAAARIQALIVNYFAGEKLENFFSNSPDSKFFLKIIEASNHTPLASKYLISKQSNFDSDMQSLSVEKLPSMETVFDLAQAHILKFPGDFNSKLTQDEFIGLVRDPKTIKEVASAYNFPDTPILNLMYSCWKNVFIEHRVICSILKKRIERYKDKTDQFPDDLRANVKKDLQILQQRLDDLNKTSIYDYYLQRTKDFSLPYKLCAWPQ